MLERFFMAGRRRRAATLVGIEAGLLAECPVCRDITDTGHVSRLSAADRIADEWVQRGDERLRPVHGDSAAVKQLVRRVVEKSDIHCTCDKSG
jgi:ribosomal protein L44E